MTANVLPQVIRTIDLQLSSEKTLPFAIDEKTAQSARELFNKNYHWKWFYSKCSSLVGIAGLAGFGLSVFTFCITPVPAIGLAVASLVLGRIWVNTRNREGYALEQALAARDEHEIINRLSLGANIYQKVWLCGNAAACLFAVTKGAPRSVIQWFAEKGLSKVVAYLAMLAPDVETRGRLATEALSHAKDVKTAQLLIDLGGRVLESENLLRFCCLFNELELLSFFVQRGASLDAGIVDYEKWDTDCEERRIQFGERGDSGHREGVAENLHSDFKTPLEHFFVVSTGVETPYYDCPSVVLEALCLNPTVYRDKRSVEELYHSLNRAGLRIRRRIANLLFQQLLAETEQRRRRLFDA